MSLASKKLERYAVRQSLRLGLIEETLIKEYQFREPDVLRIESHPAYVFGFDWVESPYTKTGIRLMVLLQTRKPSFIVGTFLGPHSGNYARFDTETEAAAEVKLRREKMSQGYARMQREEQDDGTASTV